MQSVARNGMNLTQNIESRPSLRQPSNGGGALDIRRAVKEGPFDLSWSTILLAGLGGCFNLFFSSLGSRTRRRSRRKRLRLTCRPFAIDNWARLNTLYRCDRHLVARLQCNPISAP